MATPSKRQIAAAQRRTLKTMRAKLLDMAAQWADVDEYCVNILTDAAETLLSAHTDLLENAEAE
ncbi:hypothetical protein ACNQFN_11345 [Thauera butanivorans]|uniref:hypothetical protein n=1 Tax=Thauera butanivorans TaxID=86174 RepID=UPI003AB5CA28